MDENNVPSVYHPPRHLANERDYDRWREQICDSIERMSGVPCNALRRIKGGEHG